MPRPGGKPRPTAINDLTGNPGHRGRNHDEPKYEVKTPECPEHMDDIARAEWNRIGPLMAEQGLLTEADMAALMAYCRAFSLFVEADKNVQQYGTMLVSKKSNFYQSPYVNQMNAAIKQMVAIATEFGLTPSSRARLKAISGGLEVNATLHIDWDELMLPPSRDKDAIESQIIDAESRAIEGNGHKSNGNGKPKGDT